MPFTPTHTIAVLPIARYSSLPLSALAIGSMIPDVPLFLPFGPGYQLTHSWWGLFVACLPMGLALYLLFQAVLKAPLLSLFPPETQARLAPVSSSILTWQWRHLVAVSFAIVLGALTHIVWDAFTHKGTWGVALLPWLQTSQTLFGRPLPGYKLLQYGSSVVGLPTLLYLGHQWLRKQTPQEDIQALASPLPRKLAWGLLLALPLLAVGWVSLQQPGSLAQWVGQLIRRLGWLTMGATFVYAVLFYARR